METRRRFLQASAAVLGAQAAAKAAPSERVNLGFIGVGIQGSGLLRRFHAMPDVNVVSCADLYDGYLENAREATDGKIQTGKEYRAVLDRKEIDAVVIAAPDHWHMRMVLDAIDAGKDIYCEKPLTWSIEEGHKIQKAMKNSKRILQVGSAAKTSASTEKAREIVKSGVLGDINLVRGTNFRNSEEGAWRYPIPPDASPQTVDWAKFLGSSPKIPWSAERFFRWRCWWEYSGGVATDLFVHLLTTLHEILDLKLPKNVVSNGGIFRWKDGRTVPDLMTSLYEYPQRLQIELTVNLGNARGDGARGLQIMGSQGTLVVGGREGSLTLYREAESRVQRYGTSAWPKRLRDEYFRSMGAETESSDTSRGRNAEEIPVPRDPNRPSHLGFFIKSVKDRTPSVEDAEAGHNAAAAAHMANRAYREGRRIET